MTPEIIAIVTVGVALPRRVFGHVVPVNPPKVAPTASIAIKTLISNWRTSRMVAHYSAGATARTRGRQKVSVGNDQATIRQRICRGS